MSFYLEQLQKKGLLLRYEQEQARKALRHKLPKRQLINKMRINMDKLVDKQMGAKDV